MLLQSFRKKKLSWEVEKDRTPEKKVNGVRCTTEVKCTQRKEGMCCWDCKNKSMFSLHG